MRDKTTNGRGAKTAAQPNKITWARAWRLFDSAYVAYRVAGLSAVFYGPWVFSPENEDKAKHAGGFSDGNYDLLENYGVRATTFFEREVAKAIANKQAEGTVTHPKFGSINWWLAELKGGQA